MSWRHVGWLFRIGIILTLLEIVFPDPLREHFNEFCIPFFVGLTDLTQPFAVFFEEIFTPVIWIQRIGIP